jgi:hypothetical protein
MTEETTIPIEQSGAPELAPAAEEIRGIAQHRNFRVGSKIRSISCIWKRGEIAKQFEQEFKRREVLSPADAKYAVLWNAAADGEQQRLGRVVVRVIESSERKSSIDEKKARC